MDWIKKRYDQFLLVLAALALLAVAGLLALRSKSFPENFGAAHAQVVPGNKIPELDLTEVKKAEKLVAQPSQWVPAQGTNQSIFVPPRYALNKTTGLPEKIGVGSNNKDSLTQAPIQDTYFINYSMNPLDPSVPKQDPDKDGFTNEDEWRGDRDGADPNKWSGVTNPGDPKSHTDPSDPKSYPPLHTKLFLKQWIRVRFRLLFQAYDGDPSKPAEMSFQINAVDRGRKTEFLKIGDKVANSPFKLKKFEFKEQINVKIGEKEDVSELTVTNIETNDDVVLVKGKETDSPDSYGLFDYQITGKDIQVKKLQEFILLPDKEKRYKLIDIKDGQALIQLPDGGTYVVVPDSRKK